MTIGDYITTIADNITTIWLQREDKKGEKWGTVQFLVYRQNLSLHHRLINYGPTWGYADPEGPNQSAHIYVDKTKSNI